MMSELDFEELITPNLISHYSEKVCVEKLQTKDYEVVYDHSDEGCKYKIQVLPPAGTYNTDATPHLAPSADDAPPTPLPPVDFAPSDSNSLPPDGASCASDDDPLLSLLQRHLCVTCVDCGQTFQTEAALHRHVRVHTHKTQQQQQQRLKTKGELKAMTTDGDICMVTQAAPPPHYDDANYNFGLIDAAHTLNNDDTHSFTSYNCSAAYAPPSSGVVANTAPPTAAPAQHVCRECGKVCASERGLQVHVSAIHQRDREPHLECAECGRLCASAFGLARHMTAHGHARPKAKRRTKHAP